MNISVIIVRIVHKRTYCRNQEEFGYVLLVWVAIREVISIFKPKFREENLGTKFGLSFCIKLNRSTE